MGKPITRLDERVLFETVEPQGVRVCVYEHERGVAGVDERTG